MTVESADDRLSFLSPDEFGELATYTPNGGAAVPGIAGIYDGPHLPVLMGEIAASDQQPTLLCRSADLPGAARGGDAGDLVALSANDRHGALTFRVIDLQPDGIGMTLITLGLQ